MNERRSLWKDQNEWEPDPNQPALRPNSSDCSTNTSGTTSMHRTKRSHEMRVCARTRDTGTRLVTDQIARAAANTSVSAVTDSNPTVLVAIGETAD